MYLCRTFPLQQTYMSKYNVPAVCSVLLMLAACENTPQFRIKGEITEAADKVLYLEEAAIDGIRVVDSTRLDKAGRFDFSRKAPDAPDFYRLRIGSQVINIGADSTETITVKAQLPSMQTGYTVEGSEESRNIKKITLAQMELQEKIRALVSRGMLPGDLQDSVNLQVERHKERMKREYIYQNPRAGYAYYALFQRINGTPLFNPETSREDVRAFAAVATSWDLAYPHSLRTSNLHNIAMRGMRQTRKQAPQVIPEELVKEVTLLDLALPDMRGANRTLSGLKGKVVLLDFTVYMNQASPARNIALRELYSKYAPQGLEIYQVSFDADEHFWKTSADNLPWICVRDAEGASAITYRVTDLPTYFLIDRENALYKRSSDIKDAAQLEAEIKKLLAKQS